MSGLPVHRIEGTPACSASFAAASESRVDDHRIPTTTVPCSKSSGVISGLVNLVTSNFEDTDENRSDALPFLDKESPHRGGTPKVRPVPFSHLLLRSVL